MPSPTQGVEEGNVGGLFELRGGGVQLMLILLIYWGIIYILRRESKSVIFPGDLAHHKGQTNLRLK